MDTIDVEVARLQEKVSTLQTDVSDIRADQKAQNTKLDLLVADRYKRKGAQAVTKILLGVATSGGLLGWAWEHFHK